MAGDTRPDSSASRSLDRPTAISLGLRCAALFLATERVSWQFPRPARDTDRLLPAASANPAARHHRSGIAARRKPKGAQRLAAGVEPRCTTSTPSPKTKQPSRGRRGVRGRRPWQSFGVVPEQRSPCAARAHPNPPGRANEATGSSNRHVGSSRPAGSPRPRRNRPAPARSDRAQFLRACCGRQGPGAR
jgi:hypothetical protein